MITRNVCTQSKHPKEIKISTKGNKQIQNLRCTLIIKNSTNEKNEVAHFKDMSLGIVCSYKKVLNGWRDVHHKFGLLGGFCDLY